MTRRTRRALLLAVGCGLLLACDPDSLSPPPGRCTEAGMQCPLPDGPLGVCERATCPAGSEPPCFRCVPQH